MVNKGTNSCDLRGGGGRSELNRRKCDGQVEDTGKLNICKLISYSGSDLTNLSGSGHGLGQKTTNRISKRFMIHDIIGLQ